MTSPSSVASPLTHQPELRLCVSIVNYNTRELLLQSLATLEDADEIIVVDNASTDGSPDAVAAQFPHVHLIRNALNRGFGAAHNQALTQTQADVILLLNSDAWATPGALKFLKSHFASHPECVAAGGQLLFPDGTIQNSCSGPLTLWAVFCEQSLLEKAFPLSPFFSPYWLTRRLLRQHPDAAYHRVTQIMGACLALRPRERFDEDFFLYCEDTELCARLIRHGEIHYIPAARFHHQLGASSTQRWEAVARYNRGKELFFRKHHGPAAASLCWFLNRAGALFRLGLWLAATLATLGTRPRFRRQVQLFAKVLFAPLSGPPLPPDAISAP